MKKQRGSVESGVLILAIIFLGIVGVSSYAMSYWSCSSSAAQNEVQYRYSFMGGCSYKHATTGIWVPKKNYRAVGD